MTERDWLACTDATAMVECLLAGRLAGLPTGGAAYFSRQNEAFFLATFGGPSATKTPKDYALASMVRVWDGALCQEGAQLVHRRLGTLTGGECVERRRAAAGAAGDLRCIVGNPWRYVPPLWGYERPPAPPGGVKRKYKLAPDLGSILGPEPALPPREKRPLKPWLTPDVLAVARAADSEAGEGNSLLPGNVLPLHDALMDGGCDCEQLLEHLREPRHTRGCWVIDLLVGRDTGEP